MMLSLIVPSNKSWASLKDFVDHLSRLFNDNNTIELIVVFNGPTSRKDTITASNEYSIPQIRFISTPVENANFARNIGAKRALGCHLLFLDDDCHLESLANINVLLNPLICCPKNHENTDLVASGGLYVSGKNSSIYGLAYNWITNSWLKFRFNDMLVGGFVIYKKSVFLDCGGFNESLRGSAEEVDLNLFLTQSRGKKLTLVINAKVLHLFNGGFKHFISRAYGFGRLRTTLKPVSYFSAPSSVIFGLMSSNYFCTKKNYINLPLVTALFIAFYTVVIFGRIVSIAMRSPLHHRTQPINI